MALPNIKNKSKQFNLKKFLPCYRVCGGYLLGFMILKRKKQTIWGISINIMFTPIGIPFLETPMGFYAL